MPSHGPQRPGGNQRPANGIVKSCPSLLIKRTDRRYSFIEPDGLARRRLRARGQSHNCRSQKQCRWRAHRAASQDWLCAAWSAAARRVRGGGDGGAGGSAPRRGPPRGRASFLPSPQAARVQERRFRHRNGGLSATPARANNAGTCHQVTTATCGAPRG